MLLDILDRPPPPPSPQSAVPAARVDESDSTVDYTARVGSERR